ncbi:hypothetical protein ACH4UR_10250 [Streptomyces lydicus]
MIPRGVRHALVGVHTIGALRLAGATSIAAALRHSRNTDRPLALLGLK